MPADILIYIVVVIVLFFWLKNVLGTRHGSERERPNPLSPPPNEQASTSTNTAAADVQPAPSPQDDAVRSGVDMPRNVSIASKDVDDGLMQISLADRRFELDYFIQGAQEAFVIIVEAFAKGDRDTLKPLLADEIYSSFDTAIANREKREEKMETEIQAVRKSDILKAWKQDNMAFIRIRFTADEVTSTKDENGEIIAGDPDRVFEMKDVWTFGRNIKSKDPAWLLYETRDDEVEEHNSTPIPDSGDAENATS